MKKEELEALSTEELMKKEAGIKKANNVLIILLSLLLIAAVYLSVKEQTFDPLLAVPLALSGIVFNSFNTLKMIKAEKESRS
jgi:Na+-transporting methylmalonyl-CoA/oxaloacetate decarboxylase beta subunit